MMDAWPASPHNRVHARRDHSIVASLQLFLVTGNIADEFPTYLVNCDCATETSSQLAVDPAAATILRPHTMHLFKAGTVLFTDVGDDSQHLYYGDRMIVT
jgi:hypothetical protein